MKRYRIVNKKRFKTFQIVSIMLLAFLLFIGSLFFNNTLSLGGKVYEEETVRIQSGDTLWSIANDLIEDSNKNIDIREVVFKIKELNNIENSKIYPGDVIRLPEI